MASSSDLQEDMSPRLPILVKPSDRQSPKKEFDIRLSRMSLTKSDDKESMLAYTEHVRQLNHSRKRPAHVNQMALRAHHVPKNSSSMTVRHRRKAMSLNDLIDRKKNPFNDRRQHSARSLSSLKVSHLPPKHLRISFVSASDLHEILECSFKSKGTRSNALRLSLWESAASIPWASERHKGDPHPAVPDSQDTLPKLSRTLVSSDKTSKSEFPLFKQDVINQVDIPNNHPKSQQATNGSLPTSLPVLQQQLQLPHNLLQPQQQPHHPIQPQQQPHHILHTDSKGNVGIRTLVPESRHIRPSILRHRPRRAKRMTLHRPDLGVIPEGEGDGDGGARNKPHLPSMSSLAAIKGNRSSVAKDVKISFVEYDLESLIGPSNIAKSANESMNQTQLSAVPPVIGIRNDTTEDPEDSSHMDKKLSQNSDSIALKGADDHAFQDRNTVSHSDVSKSNKSKAAKKMNKLIFLRDIPERHYQRK